MDKKYFIISILILNLCSSVIIFAQTVESAKAVNEESEEARDARIKKEMETGNDAVKQALKDSILESYKSGKISEQEKETALRDIENRFSKKDFEEKFRNNQIAANEASAFATLNTIYTACEIYKSSQKPPTFPPDLKILASAKPPYIPTELGEGKKEGYNFIYALSNKGYRVFANPVTQGITGIKRYYLDETGFIRFTSDGTEPSIRSEQVQGIPGELGTQY